MSSFVSVGNGHQPFSRLLDAVDALADMLPQPVVVQHGHTPFSSPRCIATAFMPMEDFVAQMASASLVIIHGGVGSILSALQAGKVPIVAPRVAAMDEIIDDHQLGLVRALAAAGRVIMLDEVSRLSDVVADLRAMEVGDVDARQHPAVLVAMVRQALTIQSRRAGGTALR